VVTTVLGQPSLISALGGSGSSKLSRGQKFRRSANCVLRPFAKSRH